MDWDDFDAYDNSRELPSLESGDPAEAVKYIDIAWLSEAGRKSRRMDLIGDYAGSEPFIIDGDSLIQHVLDDPLLALAREGEYSFQILHAMHSLECAIDDFLKRSAVFDIVFWRDSRHLAIQTGSDDFVFSSRCLARTMLTNHLSTLHDIGVHFFTDLSDPKWLTYLRLKKPMFIMMNDGGPLDVNSQISYSAERILHQRILMFLLLAQGLSVASLQGAEFRESKIISFIFEQGIRANAQNKFPRLFWKIATQAVATLDSYEAKVRKSYQSSPIPGELVLEAPTLVSKLSAFAHTWLSSAASKERFSRELLFIFIAHCCLLPTITLEERARSLQPLDSSLVKMLQRSFFPSAFLVLDLVQVNQPLIDVDGRVFVELLLFSLRNPLVSFQDTLGHTIHMQLEVILAQLPLAKLNFIKMASHFPISSTPFSSILQPPALEGGSAFSVLPFSNKVFDEALSSIHVEVESTNEDISLSHLSFNKNLPDTQHWHNHHRAVLPKHLGGEDVKPVDEWQRKRRLRSNQKFMAQLQSQAKTLTGTFGTILEPITIVSSSKSSAKTGPNHTNGAKPAKGAASRKKEHISSADKIRKANLEKKQAEEDESNTIWWTKELKTMENMSTPQKVSHLQVLLRNEKRSQGDSWLAVEQRLYAVHLEFLQWLEHPDCDGVDREAAAIVRDKFTVAIMRKVKHAYECGGLYSAASRALASSLTAMGFVDYIPSFVELSPNPKDDDRRLSFSFVKLMRSKKNSPVHKFMQITEDPVLWQLRLFGEYMDRSMDSQYDPRVSFKPDAWQRKVLDCLDDDGHSVLVVAPTSAGKTFISYYAMEKVLRASDDDILVYVAPTKALVSQIAAEVYGRFSKTFRSGRSCWAIHTRDYRINEPTNCQILVTVPEVLAILLLSPPLARIWTPRIKRIILDEIHTIGQQEGGAVWEQIILFAPCPIIGLSATVGQPERFNAWLQTVQEAHGFKHSFIHHPHRYSHLRKFKYLFPPKSETEKSSPFVGLDSYSATNRLRFLHPVSMLSFGVRNLPPDFSLEAADCLSLFQTFASFPDSIPVDKTALEPSHYFNHHSLLKQKDILEYEQDLKNVLEKIMASSDLQDQSSSLAKVVNKVQDPYMAKLSFTELNTPPSKERLFLDLIYLVSDLHVNGDLPALLFQFDRQNCEIMARVLLSVLIKGEKRWRETSPEWKQKIHRWEVWKAGAKIRERQAEKVARRKKADPEELETEKDNSWERWFDPNDPSPQFSFSGTVPGYTKNNLEEDIRDIQWASIPQWALQALRRGIAVHHAGMNKRYRTLVESLYRLGFVRVIIATGTLALGINAPTKTSVFCGDSPFLTALMYRQCAGRAGRRGYDLLGKVIFYGIAMDRAQRLVLSRIPSLGGNFPLTSTMVLRLFNLLHGSDYAPVAVKAVKSLMELPHVSFVSETGKAQLLHHIRFSIDYLRRAGLLDGEGNAIDLFGIAAHLYYTEPSNLALVALLHKGAIHDICAQSSETDAKREFFILMAHLFGRRYLPKVYARVDNIKDLIKKSPSIVVLPPMPGRSRKILMEHDKDILRVFSGYAQTFASHYKDELGPDCQLIVSGKTYPVDNPEDSKPAFREYLSLTALRITARSPFVANSGHDDHFRTVPELTHTTRRGLHLNEHAIPSLQHITNIPKEGGDTFALNAYLLDFYVHGQKLALARSNGIREGDLWYILQDFTLTLKTICSGLERLFIGGSEALGAGSEDGEPSDDLGTVDPAEMDAEDEQEDEEHGDTTSRILQRPSDGISERDWKVLKIAQSVTAEFEEKFKAIWA